MVATHNEVQLQIVSPDQLDGHTRRQMYQLMTDNYEGVQWQQFNDDLDEKQFVMIGSADGTPKGFTTGRRNAIILPNGQTTNVLFSGDTIIDTDYRGNPIWAIHWLRHAMSLAQKCDTTLWWMLTSKGHLTYRYLPIWFNQFYPRYDCPTPYEITHLLNILGKNYGRTRYDPSRHVIKSNLGQRLRENVAPPHGKILDNPHVQFFLKQNPGWQQGDELLCLAKLNVNNLRSALSRRLLKIEVGAT